MKIALLIGINYLNTEYELNGCFNDVRGVYGYLYNNGYQEHNITVLSEMGKNDKKPTYANIINSLMEKIKQINRNSEVTDFFIHYSGHGTYIRDKEGDEIDNMDEAWYTLDNELITDDNLYKLLSTIKREINIFVLSDCCHSGTILDLPYNLLKDKLTVNICNKKEEMTANIKSLSGCRDDQTSADAYICGKYQGALTWAFLDSIKPDRNHNNNLLLLYNDIIYKLMMRYEQRPQLSFNRF